jgi:hypothetical protein
MSKGKKEKIAFGVFGLCMGMLAVEVCLTRPSLFLVGATVLGVFFSILYLYAHEDDFLEDDEQFRISLLEHELHERVRMDPDGRTSKPT